MFGTSGQSFITSINPNLVVPVFIVFALMRIKSAYNVALRLISGLRFFTQRRFAAISKTPTANPTPSDILEKSIAQLNLTMIELDDSMATRYVLRTQLFYDLFEVMVNLGLAGFLAYLWSMNYHCAVPNAVPSCWVVLLLLTLAMFAFQCLLQVLFMTGWRARESKMAAIAGLVTFLVSIVLAYFNLSYVSTETAVAIAVHINAMLMQVSRDMSTISLDVLVPAVHVALSGFLGLMATGLVIPAIRYTQAIDTMVFGVRAAIVSTTDKTLLWVDFALPLAVAVVFSPLPQLAVQLVFPKYGTVSCASDNNGTCSSITADQAGAFNNALMTVQMALCGAMLVVRVLCMKKHLQCFLDSVVRVVSAHLIATGAGHAPDQSSLMPKVKACTDYLMAAATQYLAVPLFAFACLLLLHKSSPVGTGLCFTIYQAAGLDQAPLLSSISSLATSNTSALALETAAKPYLSAVLTTIAGASMVSSKNPTGVSPTEAIQQFATKLSTIYSLPAAPAVALCQAIICMHSLLWFALTLAGILAWKYRPGLIVGSRNAIPVPSVPAPTAEPAVSK